MDDARPWESLAGLRGSADRCTCSDAQLSLVGCDCDAEQNLPMQCSCGRFLRTQEEIGWGECVGCWHHRLAEEERYRNAEDDYYREGVL